MKRFLKVLSLVLCLSMLLALCVGCNQNTPSGGEGSDGLSGTISLYMHINDYPEIAQEWADGFTKENPNVKVDLQMMTGSSISENLTPRITAGALPDVFSGNMSDYFTDLADRGLAADVSKTKAWGDMLDNLKPLWTSPKGTSFGVSTGVATTLIYYNVDLFDKAGITELPKNWDEFLAACDKLKAAGITPFAWAGGDTNLLSHGPLVWGMANDVVSEFGSDFNTKILTEKNDFKNWDKIYDRILTLRDAGYFSDDFLGINADSAVQMFTAGDAAMIMHGSWATATFFDVSGLNVGCMAPPWNAAGKELVGVLGTESGVMIANNDNIELSSALFDYMLFDNFKVFQNKRKGVPPFKTDKGFILDKRMSDYVEQMGGLNMTIGIAAHILPAPITAEAIKLCQDVCLDTKTSDIPGILSEIQDEYIDSKN